MTAKKASAIYIRKIGSYKIGTEKTSLKNPPQVNSCNDQTLRQAQVSAITVILLATVGECLTSEQVSSAPRDRHGGVIANVKPDPFAHTKRVLVAGRLIRTWRGTSLIARNFPEDQLYLKKMLSNWLPLQL